MTEKTKDRFQGLKAAIKESLYISWLCIQIGMSIAITWFMLKKLFV